MSTVEGGLAFIAKTQRSDGGFWEYVWDAGENKKQSERYRTTFATSLIAIALNEVPKSQHIRKQCADFLLTQKSSFWSWNYWARSSSKTASNPYPDDLDDTFLALSALWLYDPSLLSPEAMAGVANLLFETETQPGGPYRTWLMEQKAGSEWQDTDIAVNANIMYFMRLQAITLPGLDAYIEKAISENALVSPYYPPTQPILYYVTRAYEGKKRRQLQELVDTKKYELIGRGPHETALTLTSLLRLGCPSEGCQAAAEYLRDSQQSDGSWQTGPMCIGPRKQPSCSPALTAALCLEALSLYEKTIKSQAIYSKSQISNSDYDTIKKRLTQTLEDVKQPDLKRELKEQFTKMYAYDKDGQIILLPQLVARAFNLTPKKELLQCLAEASMWGWIAYTIYDDFLDGEGTVVALPAAIFAERQVVMILQKTLPSNASFHEAVAKIMEGMDGASTWEVTHCRGRIEKSRFYIEQIPDYGKFEHLAQRSFGHAIAGLGVVFAADELEDSDRKIQALSEFFFHYIIARQLNDDAHDWEEDLESGHVNAVGALILQKWLAVSPNHSLKKGVDIKNKKKLQLLLWDEGVIDEVCSHIQAHVLAARSTLDDAGVSMADAMDLLKLLEGPELAAKKALQTRDEAIKFIEAL